MADKPLTELEIQEVRSLLETQRRLGWLGRWVRNIAIAMVGTLAAWVAIGDWVKRFFSH